MTAEREEEAKNVARTAPLGHGVESGRRTEQVAFVGCFYKRVPLDRVSRGQLEGGEAIGYAGD